MGVDKEAGAGLSRIEDFADRGSDLSKSRLRGEVRDSNRREWIWCRGSTYPIHQLARTGDRVCQPPAEHGGAQLFRDGERVPGDRVGRPQDALLRRGIPLWGTHRPPLAKVAEFDRQPHGQDRYRYQLPLRSPEPGRRRPITPTSGNELASADTRQQVPVDKQNATTNAAGARQVSRLSRG